MITLGQASNYSLGRSFRHLLAWGTKRDAAALCADLAQKYHTDATKVALYHTGRSALTAAILAVKEQATDQPTRVVIPGLTCIAVVRAVKAAGCEPVFVDINAENLEYDYEMLEQRLQEKPAQINIAIEKKDNVCYNRSIILVQNTLGIAWNVTKLNEIAQKYQAMIVEDLAHSAGRFYPDGREAGMIGDAAALSFGKGKAIDTISGGAAIVREGGALVQPDRKPKLSDRLRDRWYPIFGGIARGLWRCGLGKIWIGGLVKVGWVQRSADAELDLSRRLTHWQAKLARCQLQDLPKTPLREFRLVNNRAEVLEKLYQNGYCLDEIWYDTPVSPKRYASEVDFPDTECPQTVEISKQIINFPTWYKDGRMDEAYRIVKEYEIK